MKNVLVINQKNYERPFVPLAQRVSTMNIADPLPDLSLKSVDLLVFTGGEDVDPALYGEEKRLGTNSNPKRDMRERFIYRWAREHKIPCVGICRGGQFLNVMNGGKLHQHVHNHTQNHAITTHDGTDVVVTSTHHQMMIPAQEGQLLAYATDQAFIGSEAEPEVVWYGDTKNLCVQFHPEYMDESSGGWKYFQKLLKEKFL